MLIAIVPLLFAIAGVLIYVLASNAKVVELGRLTYLSSMIALMLELAKHVVRIG
jgi:hypothetical protein